MHLKLAGQYNSRTVKNKTIQTCVACIGDRLYGMFVVKIRKGEGIESPILHDAIGADVDG